MIGITRKQPAGMHSVPARINGMPGMVCRLRGAPQYTLSLEIVDGRVAGVYIVRNPDKLRNLAAAA
jgi:RNA polymerase sigma-70 factor (ECF subfamily)